MLRLLILSRAIEGFGLLATVLVIPDLLQQASRRAIAIFMLAIWGSYMPIGTVFMLLLGPVLPKSAGARCGASTRSCRSLTRLCVSFASASAKEARAAARF